MDPGGMKGESRLIKDGNPLLLRASADILYALGPLVRLVDKSVMNSVDVPAEALASLACSPPQSDKGYFVLDEERSPSQQALDTAAWKALWNETVINGKLTSAELEFLQ
jgi:hypothetical protein